MTDDVVKARRELSRVLSDKSANWLRGYRDGLQTIAKLFTAQAGTEFTGAEVGLIISETLKGLPDA